VLFSQQSALTEHTFSFFAIAMWRIQSAFPLLFLNRVDLAAYREALFLAHLNGAAFSGSDALERSFTGSPGREKG
jgi:hypothetical protein